METLQSYNPRTKRWVKYKKYADGRTKITQVKKTNPQREFKGVKIAN